MRYTHTHTQKSSFFISLITLFVTVVTLFYKTNSKQNRIFSFSKRILHILLLQEAIRITTVKIPIKESILDYSSYRVHSFIDKYMLKRDMLHIIFSL